MPEESAHVRIKVRTGESEAEVEASLSSIREAIELIPELVSRLPSATLELGAVSQGRALEAPVPRAGEPAAAEVSASPQSSSIPMVTVERGDSLSDVIIKFFADPWGRSPRKLMEVREALQSYGLNYPKQSVAVALLRLAKASRIRRFKGESGEYVYTASTGTARISAPLQPASRAAIEEPTQALEGEGAPEAQEEQLNLDAPKTG